MSSQILAHAATYWLQQPHVDSCSHILTRAATPYPLQPYFVSCSHILTPGVRYFAPISPSSSGPQHQAPEAHSWLLGLLCTSSRLITFGLRWLQDCQAAPSIASTASKFSGACCTQHTAHCTLHPAHFTLHTAHYKLHTAHFTLHTAHCKLHTAYCTWLTVHCTLLTASFTLHTEH